MALKDNLKQRRKQLGLTLEEVAKKIGITRQTVQKYESGVVSNIPLDRIELLAKALDTTPAYLMGWEDNANIENPKITNVANFIKSIEEQVEKNPVKTEHLTKLLLSYQAQPETVQKVIDKLLDIFDE